MIKGIMRHLIVAILLISAITFHDQTANAQSNKVMWGKTELKVGQVGKVTVLSNTSLVKLESNGSLNTVRALKKGEEFRVYSYKSNHGGLYGVGGGSFIYKSPVVKYETPSKSKLALLSGKTPVVTLPKPTTPKPNPVVTKDKNTIYKEKLNTIVKTQYKNYREYAEAIYKVQEEIKNDNFNGMYELEQEIKELYYQYGIEVDEMVFTFDNGVSLLVFERSIASYSGNYPTNRSASFYNNEYYLYMGLVETILSADLNMYNFDKPTKNSEYDGTFSRMGPAFQPSAEFKDESNKKLGTYEISYLTNTIKDKTLKISKRDFPWADAGTGTLMMSSLNPYSVDEVKEILDMEFELTYDSKNARMTVHFNKPSKEKSGMGDW